MSPNFQSNIKTQACEDQDMMSEEVIYLGKRRPSTHIAELEILEIRRQKEAQPRSMADRTGSMIAIMTPPRPHMPAKVRTTHDFGEVGSKRKLIDVTESVKAAQKNLFEEEFMDKASPMKGLHVDKQLSFFPYNLDEPQGHTSVFT